MYYAYYVFTHLGQISTNKPRHCKYLHIELHNNIKYDT